MSNTVYLYALTGETAVGRSLSTADDEARRLAARARRAHGFDIPVIWHDIDYPLVKLWTANTGTIDPVFPTSADLTEFRRVVEFFGGTVKREGRYGHSPLRWQIPTLDIDRVEAWAASTRGSLR